MTDVIRRDEGTTKGGAASGAVAEGVEVCQPACPLVAKGFQFFAKFKDLGFPMNTRLGWRPGSRLMGRDDLSGVVQSEVVVYRIAERDEVR
jgi:hypothetical protein